jgi:hypothetical protein
MIVLLNSLKENGTITAEEYNNHSIIKQNFINERPLSKVCLSINK